MIICLAGMHRSGTSLMASYFEYCGIPMGDNLLGSGQGNKLGHFEDCGFLDFHKRILEDNGSHFFVPRREIQLTTEQESAGKALLASRAANNSNWGWKEPRTTLFLDYWSSVDPEIKFIFMYRDAYKVTESLYRRMKIKYKYFMPWLAPDSWLHYNQQVLRYMQENPGKALLISIDGINKSQNHGLAAVGRQLGVDLLKPYSDIYKPNAMTSGTHRKSFIIKLYLNMTRLLRGEAIDASYKKLQKLAFINDQGVINAQQNLHSIRG